MPIYLKEDKLWSWAREYDENTMTQARRTSRLPIIAGHVSLMPDAHWGMGSTVGSVIPTEGAIIPAAVGVDIGCGMCAVHTKLNATHLRDDMQRFYPDLREVVPAGLNKGHDKISRAAQNWMEAHDTPSFALTPKMKRKALEQFGSLGSGNHFFEICLDTNDEVWLVLHSGSRGIGNQLAKIHIDKARKLHFEHPLEDIDLAYFEQETEEFDAYITDMLWAQDYAWANRQQMMELAIDRFWQFLSPPKNIRRPAARDTINCHHNYSTQETHGDKKLWITRKGAIDASKDALGIIPGSMGTETFIVRGLGNADSYRSCSHGAGRRLSRGAAKRELSVESFAEVMGDRTWQSRDAKELLDEHPRAYKDINAVMADQADLVEVVTVLRQILNYKGTR